VMGRMFDKQNIVMDNFQFFEEILELSGYYLMLTGAVVGCVNR